MAQKNITQILDDITGEILTDGNVETLVFAFDGKAFTIDLSKANAEEFRTVLAPYIDVARPIEPEVAAGAASKTRAGVDPKRSARLKAIREWAISEGFSVAPRGRVSAELEKRYDAAQREGSVAAPDASEDVDEGPIDPEAQRIFEETAAQNLPA